MRSLLEIRAALRGAEKEVRFQAECGFGTEGGEMVNSIIRVDDNAISNLHKIRSRLVGDHKWGALQDLDRFVAVVKEHCQAELLCVSRPPEGLERRMAAL